MARKKKNNNNQTTSAAPNKEQAQKQSQEESRVIDELFGNLDEPDIESDIAELGGSGRFGKAAAQQILFRFCGCSDRNGGYRRYIERSLRGTDNVEPA